jgi:hypothetical protein
MDRISQEHYQVVNLFDWTGGIRNMHRNPLAFPANALLDGENVDLVDGGLKVRPGISYHTAAPSGYSGDVVQLRQVRFPTNESSYLLCQVEFGSGAVNELWVSDEPLPPATTAPHWEIVPNLGSGADSGLGSGAGVLSIAPLNDRAVLTEGIRRKPLVFAGGLDPSGADWAVPKAVLVTRDSGVSRHDITQNVCDKDPDTDADIGSLDPYSGWLSVCTDMPDVSGFYFECSTGGTNANGGTLSVSGYSGSWSSGAGWTDNTGGLAAEKGTVTHSGGVFASEYYVENNVPGYWHRISFTNGTSAQARLTRVLFQAPCQELTVIGEGRPDTALGFLYRDSSENSTKDFTVEVSDETYPTFARLNDGNLDSPSGMTTDDAVYVGYLTPFNAVELSVHNDYHNAQTASMSGRYWAGTGWQSLPGFVDSTRDPADCTLGTKGRISWQTPTDWRQNRPLSTQSPHGYWVELKVSQPLTAKTYISEVKVRPVMEALKKHKFAVTVRDRMVLCNRPDAPDQIDISRALEEYGFAGADSASLRIGGQDIITAAEQVFNQGFIAKTEDWYLLNGYNPQTFSVERAEAAGQAPINNRVLVRAPLTEADDKNLMGLYYINQAGAWYFAGLKVYQISQDVSWWDPASNNPKLDPENLHKAVGVYWPPRNWVIWAVPMITEGDEQPTNNRLIVYDLTLRTWLPPFTISLASICTAYHNNPNAPGKLGQLGLYGGDYNGHILRLFGPGVTRDLDDPDTPSDDGLSVIHAWAETGWLHFGTPEYRKLLRLLTLYGKTDGPGITVKVYTDGHTEPIGTFLFDKTAGISGKLFAQEQKPQNVAGRFFKFRFELQDPTDIYGLQIGTSVIREWGAV